MKRGRKSADSMAVVGGVYFERPRPPKELTKDQREVWKAVAATKPADWFGPDTRPLLAAYCGHVTTWRRLTHHVENFGQLHEQQGLDVEAFDRLLKMRERESRAMMALARSMRLTQQSQYDPKTAATQSNPRGDEPPPWHRTPHADADGDSA